MQHPVATWGGMLQLLQQHHLFDQDFPDQNLSCALQPDEQTRVSIRLLISNVGSGTIIGRQAGFDQRFHSIRHPCVEVWQRVPPFAGLVFTSAPCNSNQEHGCNLVVAMRYSQVSPSDAAALLAQGDSPDPPLPLQAHRRGYSWSQAGCQTRLRPCA